MILKLRELYLELAFAGPGVAGEDVEDELRTIDDVTGEPGFDVTELRGGEVVIEEDEGCVGGGHDFNDLVEFALADKARRVGLLAALNESGGNGRAG